MDVTIRPEQPGDEDGIRRVLEAAFPTKDEAKLVDRLRDNGRAWVSLVAEWDTLIVGHILFSPITLDPPDDSLTGVGLCPLGVMPVHQNKGIGTRLINEAIALCREAGYSFIVVMGEPSYYKRFGFETAQLKGIRNEYSAIEIFLVMELKTGSLKRRGVLARFSPEFAGFVPLSWKPISK